MSAEAMTAPAMPEIDVASVEPPATVKDSAILRQGVQLYIENGCLLIRNAFDPEFIRRLHDEFTRKYQKYFTDDEFADAHTIGDKRIMVTLGPKGAFNSSDYYAPAKVFPILEFLLTRKLIVSGLGCVIATPGSKDQPRHRDYPNIYDPGFHYPGVETFIANGPPYCISLGIPLVPLTKTTGNTRFWPGTHLTMISRKDPKLGPGVDFEADLGSCYLFDYRVIHAGVANTSDRPRLLLYNIYARPWFRDLINYPKQSPIDITEDELDGLSVRDQELFSWALVGPAGGLCYCNSGLLYKHCCGKTDRAFQDALDARDDRG